MADENLDAEKTAGLTQAELEEIDDLDDEDEEIGIRVYTITYQHDTDVEVIAVKSSMKLAVQAGERLAGALIELMYPGAAVAVRGQQSDGIWLDEVWIDIVLDPSKGEKSPVMAAIYTVNEMVVDGYEH